MVLMVPEKRLPLWTLKGTMVLPEKSCSDKLCQGYFRKIYKAKQHTLIL
jgi:hypothetical protein